MNAIILVIFVGAGGGDRCCHRYSEPCAVEAGRIRPHPRADIARQEMDDHYRRESMYQQGKVDEINAEYYRRTGRTPVPYWDMSQ